MIESKICYYSFSGLFYDGTGNDIGTEMALIEANKLNMANALAELKALKEVCHSLLYPRMKIRSSSKLIITKKWVFLFRLKSRK